MTRNVTIVTVLGLLGMAVAAGAQPATIAERTAGYERADGFIPFYWDEAKGKVLIHCQGGWGRTGTMAAAYWINMGLPAHKAITKVRQTNPGALEIPVQEDSLYELEAVIKGED